MDATGYVLLRGSDEESLSPETRRSAQRLISNHPGEDMILGLTESGELIRLVRLDGKERPHHALFLEPVATRSPVDEAAQRFGLSERECEILYHILRGASTTEIAEQLVIADCTVATHVRNIGAKMNASKRKEIVASVLGGR